MRATVLDEGKWYSGLDGTGYAPFDDAVPRDIVQAMQVFGITRPIKDTTYYVVCEWQHPRDGTCYVMRDVDNKMFVINASGVRAEKNEGRNKL
jgi:hypothetical protein